MPPRHFLSDTMPLTGGDAAAAIIVAPDGRYLLQLRDDNAGLFYPGHWGCFGGAASPGEAPLDCLKRELAEELEFELGLCREFMRFEYDLTPMGGGRVCRVYYEVAITEALIANFVLHEGAAMKLFAPPALFDLSNLTPYDSFALWLHVARDRIK